MILTDGPRMVLTPTYHVFKLYVPFQDATAVPVSFDAGTYTFGTMTLPRLDAFAARDKDGVLWLAVTNIDPNKPVEIALTGRSAKGEMLTAPRVDSMNTFDAPNAVAPRPIEASGKGGKLVLTLPAKSVAVVAIR
jgi:alpha-N-arabinofuranosidase